MSQKLGELVEKYLQVRDKKKELETRHKAELEPFNTALSKLEDFFFKNMESLGVDNLKTTAGTAYTSVTASVTTADKAAFLDFVQSHEMWHLLDVRPAKTATQEYVEEHGALPPGINVSRVVKVNVRKS